MKALPVYQEQQQGDVRPEWKLVPELAALITKAQNDAGADTRIALSEVAIAFIPITEIVFDLGGACARPSARKRRQGQAGARGRHRLVSLAYLRVRKAAPERLALPQLGSRADVDLPRIAVLMLALVLLPLLLRHQAVDSNRLPELICGFHRRGGESPTLYPVACAPQAWAAAAAYMFLGSCLGLEIDAAARRVWFRRAMLPDRIDWIRLTNLSVLDAKVDLLLTRHAQDVGIEVLDEKEMSRC